MLFLKSITTVWGIVMFFSCFLTMFTADTVGKRIVAFINGLAILVLMCFAWRFVLWRV